MRMTPQTKRQKRNHKNDKTIIWVYGYMVIWHLAIWLFLVCPRNPFGEISLNYLTKHDFPERLPSKNEIKTNIDGKSVRGKITRTPNQKHKQTSKLQVRKSYGPKI